MFCPLACSVAQLEQLERVPVIKDLVAIPVVRSLLTGVLPGLALRIFVLLLPVLLYALNRRAGAVGQADMDGHVSITIMLACNSSRHRYGNATSYRVFGFSQVCCRRTFVSHYAAWSEWTLSVADVDMVAAGCHPVLLDAGCDCVLWQLHHRIILQPVCYTGCCSTDHIRAPGHK